MWLSKRCQQGVIQLALLGGIEWCLTHCLMITTCRRKSAQRKELATDLRTSGTHLKHISSSRSVQIHETLVLWRALHLAECWGWEIPQLKAYCEYFQMVLVVSLQTSNRGKEKVSSPPSFKGRRWGKSPSVALFSSTSPLMLLWNASFDGQDIRASMVHFIFQWVQLTMRKTRLRDISLSSFL